MTQATYGYAGKILVLDLTNQSSETIDSEPYQQWGGGHGMGSALFWDYCKDKTIDAFDPGNVVTICASPFSGTPVPSSSGRTEIQGIGSYPDPEWFVRSSMGGRVGNMLKAAGYDAMVICGKAEGPVWVDVVNDKVVFKDASSLWGLDTGETQELVWDEVTGGAAEGEWYHLDSSRDGGRTMQKPAVMCIGPAGETLGRVATITHDAGHHAGHSGLGAVWGAKNLKALSVLGTGSVPIADPSALLNLRIAFTKRFAYNVDDPVLETPNPDVAVYGFVSRHPGFNGIYWNGRDMLTRPYGCQGCVRNCRHNFDDGVGNGNMCAASLFYMAAEDQMDQIHASGLMNRLGINGFETNQLTYLRNLYKMGILGPGKQIDSNLPFDKFGSWEFIEAYLTAIAELNVIGDDLAEGTARAVKKGGRYEEDSASGLFNWVQWGYHFHYDPRLEVEWSYGSVFGDRDINEHGLNWHVHWMPLVCAAVGEEPLVAADQMAEVLSTAAGLNDPLCIDYSKDGIYSDAKLRAVAWHRHYGRFWVQSMGMCDWVWPYLINYADPEGDLAGATPDYEPQFFKAVTGRDMSYEESIELGHRIFTLDRAIWYLQGRTREQEVFPEWVYSIPNNAPYPLPVYEDGAWSYSPCMDRVLERERFEDLKTRFYELEGWDPQSGCPTRATLESFGLGSVADELERAGVLTA
jgi:aldehyde:ferredoxin oxidoreductase